MAHLEEEPAPLRMMRLLFGGLISQMLALTVQLNLPDRLKHGPLTAGFLAQQLNLDPVATYRLMRGLSSLGVLQEHMHETFSLTVLGETLRRDLPGSLAGLARLAGEKWHWSALAELPHAVATGESAFSRAHGTGMFQWLEQHPEASEAFSDAMSSFSAIEAHLVASAYDFTRVTRVADVGGGHGLLLAEILSRYSNVEGVLFDLPHVASGAESTFAERGLSHRSRVIAGDFFEAVPGDCDVYLFKHILHDWDDIRARRILSRVAQAMPSDARVLIAEQVLPPIGVAHFSKIMDVGVLVMTEGGRERTQAEHAALLESAGLVLVEVTPTPGPLSLVEARRA
ncbi:MAG TPA: methyltransferase [Polyangiaceae bacterium]|nr:methyltransferase [Polyangiaceae bacterium]